MAAGGVVPASSVRVGLAITTVGRWEVLERLLASASASTHPVARIAIANQSGAPAPRAITTVDAVVVIESERGVSRGRNDAVAVLAGDTDIVGFPNDHSWLRVDTTAQAARRFATPAPPAAIGGTLLEAGAVRYVVPADGRALTRWTVWRAIEPAMWVATHVAARLRFREDIGLGSDSPWQAGAGSDLLLRIMAEGRAVLAAPDVVMLGDGERRTLTDEEWRTKLRSYARGVGYVLRLHGAGPVETAAHLALPWYRWVRRPPSGVRVPALDCFTATLGRAEGRAGRCLPSGATRLDDAALRK